MLKHYINLDLFSGLSILSDSSIDFPVSSYLDNAFQDLARCSVLLFPLFSLLLFKLLCIHLCICMCVHVCTRVEACLNGRVEVRQICSVSQTLITLYIHPTLIKTKKIALTLVSNLQTFLALSDHSFHVLFWSMVEPTQTRYTQGSCILRLQLGQPLSPSRPSHPLKRIDYPVIC